MTDQNIVNNKLETIVEKQSLELGEFKKFFTSIAPLLDKLDKNPALAQVIIDHDFINITPPKEIEVNEQQCEKYILENWDYIEHLQNSSTDELLKKLSEKFPTKVILKNDIEEFIKGYLKVLVVGVFTAAKAYEKKLQKSPNINI